MGDVIKLDFITRHDLGADGMLKSIAEEKPKYAFVIVWPEDGTTPTYHSNTGDMPVVLMRLHHFLHKYYNGDFEV